MLILINKDYLLHFTRNNLMIKILFKINIFAIFFSFILKKILKFFYYYKIKNLNFF